MSRLGNKPVELPKSVQVTLEEGQLHAKGPKGAIQVDLVSGITLDQKEDGLYVHFDEQSGLAKPMHGLYRTLVYNAIAGVNTGFEKKLQLIGVGYRGAVKGSTLELQLGFSHPTELSIPEGISVHIEKSTDITISGVDKRKVGQFAADIRAIRPPEPYKGKGVRYVGEYVRKKAGKASKGK